MPIVLYHVLYPQTLKLRRAYNHLETLQEDINIWIDGNADAVALNFDLEPGWCIVQADGLQDPKAWWGIIVGDFLHNLRSALDQLAWTLVELKGNKGSTNTTFPLISDPKEWARNVEQTRREGDRVSPLAGMSEEAIAIVKAQQPYIRSDEPRNHPLARLRWLSNTDKHRFINSSTIISGDKSPRVLLSSGLGTFRKLRDVEFVARKSLRDKTEIMRIRLPDDFPPERHDDVKVEMIPIDVAFSNGRLRFRDLSNIYNEVARVFDEISERFFGGSIWDSHPVPSGWVRPPRNAPDQ